MSESRNFTFAATTILTIWVCDLAWSQDRDVAFVRGDVDGNHSVNLADAIQILRLLFAGDRGAVDCGDAADVNDDGRLDLSDAIELLSYVFARGPSPTDPFPLCGTDLSTDDLGCTKYDLCSRAFYGVGYHESAVIFLIARSSMWSIEDFRSLKQQMIETLQRLSEDSEFAIVFTGHSIRSARATSENVVMAIQWIDSISLGAGTCQLRGVVQVLKFLNSTLTSAVVFYAGDGEPSCQGYDEREPLLRAFDHLDGFRMDTLGFDASVEGEAFLRQLAQRHDGRFVRAALAPDA